jgi:hypothetical protein
VNVSSVPQPHPYRMLDLRAFTSVNTSDAATYTR